VLFRSRITSVSLPPGSASLTPGDIQAATQSKQNVFAIDPNFRTGYSQLYNFTLQREVTPTITVEAGYVGSVSRKLPYAVGNLNISNRVTDKLGQIQAQFSEGSANFNSLQVRAAKRFSSHLSFLAGYTYGKNIDNGPAPFNLGHNLNSHNQPQNPLNLSLERAAADNDIRHNLVIGYIYGIPIGKRQRFLPNLGGVSQAILGGWQISGIFVARSGLPVNVVRNPQDRGFEGLRPDLLSDPNLPSSERTLSKYFDTGAFDKSRFTGSAERDLGNAGRNVVRGPGYVNLDVSTLKDIRIKEGTTLQLRFEAYNLTNTPHFANPNSNMAAGNFGSITQTTGNARIVQFGAKVKF
jgi:hypothetical protein